VSLPPFLPDYRASGLLRHVTSLPSPYGIGDVGPAAVAWVDRLHEAAQRWWQAVVRIGDLLAHDLPSLLSPEVTT